MDYSMTSLRIPMTDGIALYGRMWLPQAAPRQKVPVVFEYIPYRTDDVYRSADDYWGDVLASRGIAFVRVDVRGSGNSAGALIDEYSAAEIDDGVAVIAWLAAQSWCNGRVGMRGISWGAINTLLIASRQPAALRAIMPIAGTDNRLTDDAHFIGGLIGHNGLQWGTLFKLFMAGPPDPAIVGDGWRAQWQQRLNALSPVLARWLQARSDPDCWQPLQLQRVQVPAYFVAGWQDPYARPTWRMYEQCRAPKKLLIGPWGHTYPYFAAPFGLEWVEEEVAWWRAWLIERRAPEGPAVRLFIPHETVRQSDAKPMRGHWYISESVPSRSVRSFHLSDATLEDGESVESGLLQTVSHEHVVGQTKPEWLDRPPLEQSYDDELSHTWDSSPLKTAVTCCGTGEVTLRIRATSRVFSVAVRLCEVTADNQSWLVADSVQRFECDTDQPATIKLQFGAFAHQFDSGSRIRLAVSQNLWPLVYPLGHQFTADIVSGVVALPVIKPEVRSLDLVGVPGTTQLAQYKVVPPDESGTVHLIVEQPASSNSIAQGDGRTVVVGSVSRQESKITQTQPHSSIWSQESEMSWSRDGWRCVVTSGYELSGDRQYLYLREWVRARYNDASIFEQDESARLPRCESG